MLVRSPTVGPLIALGWGMVTRKTKHVIIGLGFSATQPLGRGERPETEWPMT